MVHKYDQTCREAKPNHDFQPYECQANWLQAVTFLHGLHTRLLHQLGLHALMHVHMHAHMHAHTWIHIEIAHSVNMCSVMACRALGKPLQGSVAVSGCLKEPPMPLSWKKDGYSFWVVSSKVKFDHHLQFGTLH